MTPDPLSDQELDTLAFAIETSVGHVTEYRRSEDGGQTYDDRRIGRMIANEDALARLGPRAVAELRRTGDMRAQRDALLEIVYSLPDIIQRAWDRDNSRRTQRDLETLTQRIDAAAKAAKDRP